MKQIRSFILIAIGMMVFTATASTTKLEQKQKTEFVKDVDQIATDVNVYQVKEVSVLSDAAKAIEVKSFDRKKPMKFKDINKDVGWQNEADNITSFKPKNLHADLTLISPLIQSCPEG